MRIRHAHRGPAPARLSAGLTLLELVIALGLLAIMTTAVTVNLDRQARSLGASTMRANVDLNADILLDRISEQLEFAQASSGAAALTLSAAPADTALRVADLAGFPPSGTLVLAPGNANQEIVGYTSLALAQSEFDGLDRGAQCSNPGAFGAGTTVQWEGVAAVLENQIAPLANEFTGVSSELRGNRFFRGQGTGISFRVPVRAGVGGSMFDADGEVTWGASIGGAEIASGFSAFEFVATRAVLEANLGADLNGDGDQVDIMDVGHVQLRLWDALNPAATDQSSILSPSMILQERCSYGGDLDGDGFADPIFLIDPSSGRLRIRLFSLLETRAGASVRRDETTVLLDNSAQG